MLRYTYQISDEVRAVLLRSTAEGEVIRLPEGKMPGDLYKKVNKVLEAAGGKWGRGQKGHVFVGKDATTVLNQLTTGEEVTDEVKTNKVRRNAFYTPDPLAVEIVAEADVKDQYVLEPSAGGGALVRAALAAGAKQVDAIELDPEAARALTAAGVRTHCADFLTCKPLAPIDRFPRIIMNPPFTRKTDAKHVKHAYQYWLQPGGVLVAVVLDDGNERKDLTESKDFHSVKVVKRYGEKAFLDKDTQCRTLVLRITSSVSKKAPEHPRGSRMPAWSGSSRTDANPGPPMRKTTTTRRRGQ